MVLTCAADDGYAMPLAIALYAAVSNYRGEGKPSVFIVDGGISSANRLRIAAVLAPFGVVPHWCAPNLAMVADLPVRKYLTTSAYLRLLIPDLLPTTIDRAIYLDCDVLVDTDLSEIWCRDIGFDYLLAVRDAIKFVAATSLGKCPGLELHPQDEYFNSGVLLMNLSLMRRDRLGEKAIAFCRRWPDFIHVADQDGLNATAIGKWTKLEPQWNVRVNGRQFVYADGKVLHFSGRQKPWKARVTETFRQDDIGRAHRRYDEYVKRSRWFTPFGLWAFVAERNVARYLGGVRKRLALATRGMPANREAK